MVQIWIPGEFVSERKRSIRRGKFTSRIDTPDRAAFKAKVAVFASQAMKGEPPLEGPLEVVTVFSRPKPPSWPKNPTKRNMWPEEPWKQPDLDNLVKIVSDPLSGIVYVDDAQVVRRVSRKMWGEETGVSIVVNKVVYPLSTGDAKERLAGQVTHWDGPEPPAGGR